MRTPGESGNESLYGNSVQTCNGWPGADWHTSTLPKGSATWQSHPETSLKSSKGIGRGTTASGSTINTESAFGGVPLARNTSSLSTTTEEDR
jgi:hypothetical protein